MTNNPMQRIAPAHLSPRCKAKSKRSKVRCKAPAVKGFHVCRMHGARGGAPKGKPNGNYGTGYYTHEAKAERKAAMNSLRFLRNLLAEI